MPEILHPVGLVDKRTVLTFDISPLFAWFEAIPIWIIFFAKDAVEVLHRSLVLLIQCLLLLLPRCRIGLAADEAVECCLLLLVQLFNVSIEEAFVVQRLVQVPRQAQLGIPQLLLAQLSAEQLEQLLPAEGSFRDACSLESLEHLSQVLLDLDFVFDADDVGDLPVGG